MKELVLNNLNTLIDLLNSLIISGTNILYENLPELVKQVIAYGRIELLISETILLTICILIPVFGFKLYKKHKTEEEKKGYTSYEFFDYSSEVVYTILGSATFIICLVCFCMDLSTLIKVWVSPILYVVEYLSKLI